MNTSQHAYQENLSTSTAICQLSENLFEATDSNQIAVLLAVDQSAAFDTVAHKILIAKLARYNCSKQSLDWFSDYLSNRSQFVSIGGKSSRIKSLVSGVPQGSIIGPILYIIYTNEMSDIMRIKYDCQHLQQDQEFLFGSNCQTCGNITSYADDATLTSISNSRITNQDKLKDGLNEIDKYLSNNKLAINRTKTMISEVMIGQKRARTGGTPPTLEEIEPDGSTKIIKCKSEIKLLGITLQDNITWGAHLETGEEAILPELRRTMGIFRHIGGSIPWRTKKMLIEGKIISRLRYLTAIWGGTTERYLDKTQALLNCAARFISKKDKRTGTQELMESCKWMTVREMTVQSSLLLLWKVFWLRSPNHLTGKIHLDENNWTTTEQPRLLHTTYSWRIRAAENWNSLPREVRELKSLPKFKLETKKWLIASREPG